jgi:hypothetical protein
MPHPAEDLEVLQAWFEVFELHGPWGEWIHLMEHASNT